MINANNISRIDNYLREIWEYALQKRNHDFLWRRKRETNIANNGPFDEIPDSVTVLLPDRLALGAHGGIVFSGTGFRRPMYRDLTEVLTLLIILVEETSGRTWTYRRTLESGTVEEFVVFEEEAGAKKLMFRVWPIFYTHDRRIEYKTYVRDPELNRCIEEHLHACAGANAARLMLKE